MASEATSVKKIKLLSVNAIDNKAVEPRECLLSAAMMSGMIKGMLESLPDEPIDDQKPIPFQYPALTDVVLQKVIQWCEYHYDDPPPDDDFDEDKDKRNEELSYWDNNFIDVKDRGLLFDIVDAANYLDIKGLIEVGAKHICNMIKGKNCVEVREILNIKNDFTKEEEDAIHKEVEWLNAKE